jgi:hypothetical protein
MVEKSEDKRKVDPRFVALIHSLMDLHGALTRFGNPEIEVAQWTDSERSQAFDYIKANVRSLAPWFSAFRKAKKRAGR